MIPFHLFATPEDAWVWAKANAYRLRFQRGAHGWEVSWLVRGSMPLARTVGWATETLIHAPRRARVRR